MCKRREVKRAAFVEFAGVVSCPVFLGRSDDGGVRGIVCLNDDGARTMSPPGATNDLGKKLKRAFAGGVVGDEQAAIGI